MGAIGRYAAIHRRDAARDKPHTALIPHRLVRIRAGCGMAPVIAAAYVLWASRWGQSCWPARYRDLNNALLPYHSSVKHGTMGPCHNYNDA